MANLISILSPQKLTTSQLIVPPTNYVAEDIILWHVNIDNIDAAVGFNELIKIVTDEEREKILKFYFIDDKKRALVSVLLQRAKVRHRFALTEAEYHLKRTTQVRLISFSNHLSLLSLLSLHRISRFLLPKSGPLTLGTSTYHIMGNTYV